jgi:hypothetical protein
LILNAVKWSAENVPNVLLSCKSASLTIEKNSNNNKDQNWWQWW